MRSGVHPCPPKPDCRLPQGCTTSRPHTTRPPRTITPPSTTPPSTTPPRLAHHRSLYSTLWTLPAMDASRSPSSFFLWATWSSMTTSPTAQPMWPHPLPPPLPEMSRWRVPPLLATPPARFPRWVKGPPPHRRLGRTSNSRLWRAEPPTHRPPPAARRPLSPAPQPQPPVSIHCRASCVRCCICGACAPR